MNGITNLDNQSIIGNIADLNTADRTSIVNAINYLYDGSTLATSSSTGTYADKIAELSTAYNALSERDKLHTVIIKNDIAIFSVQAISTAGVYAQMNMSGAGDLAMALIDIANSKYKTIVGSTYTDASATTDSQVFKLVLV